ncbi:MAG TPA: hypothetical protein VNM39_17975 [Verrucomicrobiae bacterium]|jgi:hypothetical protein|nr:hypothetical protein [Verrucomicrobiae bacterium]
MLLARKLVTVVGILLGAMALPAGVRAAQDQGGGAVSRPWAEGVPQDQQDQALGLFKEGNQLFEGSQHAAALAKYREALKLWEHPAIRYNTAVALINLDQPLAAFEDLERALRYGDAPLGADTYQQALTYRKLLLGQLAELDVSCVEAGAEITLDGQLLFVGPGEAMRRLLPGSHQLVARKPGFLTETRSLVLLPGKPSQEQVVLRDFRSLPTKTVRRWPGWKPWAVVGGGALLAILGVPVIVDAVNNVHSYEAEVARSCSTGTACAPGTLSPAAVDARDRSRVENVVAISLFSVGAAVMATGLSLVFLNQPRDVPVEEPSRAWLAPMLGRGQVGLQLAISR